MRYKVLRLRLLLFCHLSLTSTLCLCFGVGKIDGKREGKGGMIETKSKIGLKSEVALSCVCACVRVV